MRALVAGWFSWEKYTATAGDLMACDVACDWLRQAGLPFDVALAPPFTGGVDWRTVDPAAPTCPSTYKPAPRIGESPTRPGIFHASPLVVVTPQISPLVLTPLQLIVPYR